MHVDSFCWASGEMADTLRSGRSELTLMRVQVPPRPPTSV